MSAPDDAVLNRMQDLIARWEAQSDPRVGFLRCYFLMTSNVLAAIQRQEFNDPPWVDRLLQRFAVYYFNALEAFEQRPAAAPAVWQVAHHAARAAHITELQKLLLGVNAHINYDLVLSLNDVLRGEWAGHTPAQRAARHADHERVNNVIAATIDAVQDQVIDPHMPWMEIIDHLMGPVDELMVSHLIRHWRDDVWNNAARLMDNSDPGEQARVVAHCESTALRAGEVICMHDISGWIEHSPGASSR